MDKVKIPKWYWIVPLIIAIFCLLIGTIQLVGAVNVETATYKIETIPEIATIQFGGFHYKIDYTKFLSNYTGDMALCFDTKIRNAYALYNGDIDVTSLFKYKRYEMVKGDCYYVENIFWNINETKTLDIWFLPENSSSSPKWDTYFGDVSLNHIDLMLDPLFNTSSYKIGNIDNGVSYFWSNNLVANPDILSYVNVTLYNSNVSTASQFYHYSVASVSGGQASWKLIYNRSNSQFNYSSDVYKMHGSYPSGTFNCSIRTRYVYTNGSVNLYEANNNCWTGSTATLSTASDSLANLSNTEFYTLDTNFGADTYNITSDLRGWTYPSGYLVSNNISLPVLVSSFNVNASYVGGALLNVSFDSINWYQFNLSNQGIITLNDSISDNNGLQYKLFLLNSQSTILNLSIFFNGIYGNLSIRVFNESDGNILYQNESIKFYGSDGSFFSSSVNGSGSFSNLGFATYNIIVSTPGFSSKNYVVNMSSNILPVLNVYLNSGNVTVFNTKNTGGNRLTDVLCIARSYVNGSLVTVASYLSDVTGLFSFPYQQSTYYDFNCSLSGYGNNFFVLNPIQFSSYDIPLSISSVNIVQPSALVSWIPSSFQNNKLINFSITFASPYGSLSSYSYNVSYPNNYFFGSGSNQYGESLSNLFIINTSTNGFVNVYYTYTLQSGSSYNATYSYPIVILLSNRTMTSSDGNNYGFLTGDKVFLISFIALILMGLGYLAMGLFGSLGVGALVIGLFLNNGFLTQSESTLFIISLALIILLMIFRGRQ